MSKQVVHGAKLQCSFGSAQSSLVVLPTKMTDDDGVPAANITDHVQMLNIMPFGMCSSRANPAVAAARRPRPCIPKDVTTWSPGSLTILLDNKPTLNDTSKCMCVWEGVISVASPGQVTTYVP